MQRRKAVSAAAAASLTFLLGAAGMTANALVLGQRPTSGVGQISALTDGRDVGLAAAHPPKATETELLINRLVATVPPTTSVLGTPEAATISVAQAERENDPTAPSTPKAAPIPTSPPTNAGTVTTAGDSTVARDDETETEEHRDDHEDVEHSTVEDDD